MGIPTPVYVKIGRITTYIEYSMVIIPRFCSNSSYPYMEADMLQTLNISMWLDLYAMWYIFGLYLTHNKG